MVLYRPPKWLVIGSVIGTSVGGLLLLKGFITQTKNYDGPEQLSGKTVIITGANTGIGKETARELAKRGGRILMACRDLNRCEEARREIVLDSRNKAVHCRRCDLASLQSIRAFADRVNREETSVSILINNAGVMRCPKSYTKDGFEMQMGVNHFGHFLLTYLLLDKMKASAPSRIITLSSVAHRRGEINFDNLNSDKEYDEGTVYNQSKLANILFTKELATQLEGTGVTANAVHPGIVNTEIGRYLGVQKSFISRMILSPFLWLLLKTPRQGAQTTIYCALSPDLEKVSGKYFSDSKEQEPAPQALDVDAAKRLWTISERWTSEQ